MTSYIIRRMILAAVALAFIFMGGIWGGTITAMEAAGIGAFAAFVIGLVMFNYFITTRFELPEAFG